MTQHSQLEVIENELKQIESSKAWNQVYQKVRSDGTYDFPLTEAKSAINKPLNRYRDVLPYDHSRIILQHPTTTYINASLVKVEKVERKYILTQGPLASTSQHFWLMVWQQQTKGIIMLNKIIEKNMIKCDQYWPLGVKNGGEDTLSFPGVGLQVHLVSEAKHHHYTYRVFRLSETSSGSSREVLHFHYTTWPDFGVPQSPEAFNKFLSVVIKSGSLEPSVGPAVVHCSAGIGRSGTFCLVDTVLLMLSRGVCGTNMGTVLEVLQDMRRYRLGLIQTPDQLRFSYQAIVHGAKLRIRKDQHAANGSLGNGSVSADESSEEEGEESTDDLPPPRPPPRTDSLTRSMIEAQLRDQLEGDDDDDDDQQTDEDDEDTDGEDDITNSVEDTELPSVVRRNNVNNTVILGSLPDVPPSPDVQSPPELSPTPPPPRPPPAKMSPADSDSTPSSPEELASKMAREVRLRRKREREASLASKVTAIQAKQQAAEAWEYRKRGWGGGDGVASDDDGDDGASEQGPSKRARP